LLGGEGVEGVVEEVGGLGRFSIMTKFEVRVIAGVTVLIKVGLKFVLGEIRLCVCGWRLGLAQDDRVFVFGSAPQGAIAC
jgi:hypothetical protein